MKFWTLNAFAAFCLTACASGQPPRQAVAGASPAAGGAAASSSEAPARVADAGSTREEDGSKSDDLGYRCTFVANTGSRIKRRVCTTEAQRDAMRKQGRDYMNQFGKGGVIDDTPAQ